MKGISEERLTQLLGEAYAEYEELFIYNLLNTECVELNPWQPMTGQAWNNIESAPKDREILVFAPSYDGLRSLRQISKYHPDAGYCIDELRNPTHWQELPPDPI